jgi:hypothetical protein
MFVSFASFSFAAILAHPPSFNAVPKKFEAGSIAPVCLKYISDIFVSINPFLKRFSFFLSSLFFCFGRAYF